MSKPFLHFDIQTKNGLNGTDITNLYRKILRGLVENMNLLGEYGAETARELYSIAEEDLSDLSITVEKAQYSGTNDLVMQIKAKAEKIAFAEFGAGVTAGAGIPAIHIANAKNGGIRVAPGAWSSTEGTGEFAKYGSWHYHGEKFDRIDPVGAMSDAANMIRREAKGLLKGVGK